MKRLRLPFFSVLSFSALVSVALVGTACQHSATPSSTSTAQSASQPANPASATASDGAPVQTAPAPPVAAPAPAPPPPPPPVTLTVSSRSNVAVRVDQELNSKTTDVGETFTGALSAPLRASNGEIAFPRGTRVSGTVVASKNQGRFKGQGVLAIELHKIGDHTVTTEEYVVTQKGKGKRSAGLIGGGAGAGGLIGALAGGGKGGLIGALAGAGAGTAGAALTGNKPTVLPAESKVEFDLTTPIKVVVQK